MSQRASALYMVGTDLLALISLDELPTRMVGRPGPCVDLAVSLGLREAYELWRYRVL